MALSPHFACIHTPDSAAGHDTAPRLLSLARECSPRVELRRDDTVVLDAAGLTRLFGGAQAFGAHLQEAAAARGLDVNVALAATKTAAMMVAAAHRGISVVPARREAVALRPLPLSVLRLFEDNAHVEVARRLVGEGLPASAPPEGERTSARHYRVAPAPGRQWQASPRLAPPANGEPRPSSRLASRSTCLALALDILDRWGLATCGELAALPPADLFERLGEVGTRLWRLARGDDDRPLVRALEEERFEQALDLDWPIEGLEPLSFVLARLLEPLAAHLERRDRGAAAIHVWLTLVTRDVHHRWLDLPVPMRDARVLRTLLLLDLESHPPPAGIDRVTIAAEPAPGRVVQFSLISRPLPSPDQVSTLLARLTALMGEGRCGSPALIDSPRPGAFEMARFAPETPLSPTAAHGASSPADLVRGADDGAAMTRAGVASPAAVLRRCRRPLVAAVTTERGQPVHVAPIGVGFTGGAVLVASGPWRTSGGWWATAAPASGAGAARAAGRAWDRDEWDVALADRATYRVFRDRRTNRWYVAGTWD